MELEYVQEFLQIFYQVNIWTLIKTKRNKIVELVVFNYFLRMMKTFKWKENHWKLVFSSKKLTFGSVGTNFDFTNPYIQVILSAPEESMAWTGYSTNFSIITEIGIKYRAGKFFQQTALLFAERCSWFVSWS